MDKAWLAAGIGALSAVSLPLGTFTAMLWKPGHRALAFLMAFGAGGLLAAVAVDLVGHALDKGHFLALAGGSVVGGLLFVLLNSILNERGGFLRKASTTFTYMLGRKEKLMRRVLEQLERMPVFQHLPAGELDEIASHLTTATIPARAHVFRRGDPCSHLNIIEYGRVRFTADPDDDRHGTEIGPKSVFGHRSFFTDQPHSAGTVAVEPTKIWRLPKEAFGTLLRRCPTLQANVDEYRKSAQLASYVEGHRGGASAGVDPEGFRDQAKRMRRMPPLANVPDEVLLALGRRAFRKTHRKGHVFFHAGERIDRMYVIRQGEVALAAPEQDLRYAQHLTADDAFGHFAFLSSETCSMTAVAISETVEVWVLRRRDFDEILETSGELQGAVRNYLESGEVERYLRERHRVAAESAKAWVRDAVRSMARGRALPTASETAAALPTGGHVAMAIWLGILLDGIPESLVIGANILHGKVSLALVAGVFISNFPEALSSSVGMRRQGMRWSRVFWMWTSITVLTGVGAALGAVAFRGAPPMLLSAIEGVAAGSMLTMIAETMLPEAYAKGGSITGLSTLLGFLTAIAFSQVM